MAERVAPFHILIQTTPHKDAINHSDCFATAIQVKEVSQAHLQHEQIQRIQLICDYIVGAAFVLGPTDIRRFGQHTVRPVTRL